VTSVSPGNEPAEFTYEVRALNAANMASAWRGTVTLCVGNGGADINAPLQSTVRYLHTDALGSPVAETDASGTVVKRTRYEPYGAPTDGVYRDGPGYTGHVTDEATRLTYMQQRYYDPLAGRFLSSDPVTTDANTGAGFNRYAYASDNTYKYIDPDGRSSCANADCSMSTIDQFVGQQGSPSIDSSLPNPSGYVAPSQITFQNDNPSGASPNQPVTTETAKMVEGAVTKAGVESVNINSTTGGKHGANSSHPKGKAVDINRVDGKRVNSSNSGAARIQTAARDGGSVRENFGPTIMEKTIVPGGSASPATNQSLIDDHQDHLHLSGQQ